MMDQRINAAVYVKVLVWVRFPSRSNTFSLPRAISHFLTRANAQWEIHGFTLTYTAQLYIYRWFNSKLDNLVHTTKNKNKETKQQQQQQQQNRFH